MWETVWDECGECGKCVGVWGEVREMEMRGKV